MKRKVTAVLLGVATMVFATMTHAELPPGPHFTFTVPVRLANLPPEIGQYAVNCSVGTARSLTMATGTTFADISGGSLNADVVVNVTVTTARDPFAHPANATNYSCNVVLTSARGAPHLQYLPDNGAPNFPLASGAPFKFWARGTLPR